MNINPVKEKFNKQDFVVLCVFLICLLAGLFMFNDYGASWDENIMQVYADQSFENYAQWFNKGEVKLEHETLQYYGPFFMMMVQGASRFLDTLSEANIADLRHLSFFLVYFASVVAFYTIARRWFDRTSSLGATLLYALQPVLWGHAFINPKDAPFMSMMVISVAAGFKMVDVLHGLPDMPVSKPQVWVLSLLWLFSVLLLFLLTPLIYNWITNLVVSAKAGESNLVSMFASKLNQVPAKVYITRYFLLFLRARVVYAFLFFTALLYFWYRTQPMLLKILAVVIVPAILLGFTTSTRVLGPFAGVIVAYYAVVRSLPIRLASWRSILAAFGMYLFIALTAAYLTWPFLWMNPAGNFLATVQKMSAFPWAGQVLFNGNLYAATETPFAYLPVLLLIQMTEPVWILAVLGLGFALFGNRKKIDLVILFTLWFLLPFLALTLRHTTIFDNFRHVLFILPAVFLLSGSVFEKIAKPGWRIALIVVCLLPGIFGIMSLHPYEYAYYNQFIGGLNGAQGRFESDYWLTSFREAAEYVNANASPDAGVWVEGPGHVFSPYARADLKVNSWSSEVPVDRYEYVVASYRFFSTETAQPNAPVIFEIVRDDVILAVIRKP